MPEPHDAHDDAQDERARRTTAMDDRFSDTTDTAAGDATETEADTDSGDAADTGDDAAPTEEVPPTVVDEAERLTHLAREAADDDEATAYRADRDERLDPHDFTARVREGDSGETLVLHPQEWVDDGTIRPERVDDTDRAVELSLSGTDSPADWQAVDAHNRELVETVREAHGDQYAAVVDVLADFAGNHYAKPIEELSATELGEFETDYVTRNAWLDDDALVVLEESVRYAFDAAKERVPDW
jgi:hypothetical protein